jgi:PPM family protein phosphatase
MTASLPNIIAVAHTDRGQRHASNEDAVGLASDPARSLLLLVVADGVGGLKHGDVASKATVEAAIAAISGPADSPLGELQAALQGVNGRLFEASFEAGGAPSGSTVVAMLIADSVATVLHAGDSRAYLYRAGELRLLTRDHSLVMDQVEQGLLTEEQAANSPRRNVITRCIGVEPEVELAVTGVGELEPGDRVLLCSDGLHGVVSADELAEALASMDPLDDIAKRLIALANSYGGPDNISVAVARVSD